MKELKIELDTLKDHLKRALTKFSAFKQAQLKVKNNPDVVTIHINWSENAKLIQAREEMGAYFILVTMSLQSLLALNQV